MPGEVGVNELRLKKAISATSKACSSFLVSCAASRRRSFANRSCAALSWLQAWARLALRRSERTPSVVSIIQALLLFATDRTLLRTNLNIHFAKIQLSNKETLPWTRCTSDPLRDARGFESKSSIDPIATNLGYDKGQMKRLFVVLGAIAILPVLVSLLLVRPRTENTKPTLVSPQMPGDPKQEWRAGGAPIRDGSQPVESQGIDDVLIAFLWSVRTATDEGHRWELRRKLAAHFLEHAQTLVDFIRQEQDVFTKTELIRALSLIRRPICAQFLIEMLTSDTPTHFKYVILSALPNQKSDIATDALLSLLNVEDEDLKKGALKTLCCSPGKRVLEILETRYWSGDIHERRLIVDWIAARDETDHLAFLLGVLEREGDSACRISAIHDLELIGSLAAVPILEIIAARSTDERESKHAQRAAKLLSARYGVNQ